MEAVSDAGLSLSVWMQGASAGTRSKGGTGGVYQLAPATHTLSSCGALLATRRGDLARASERKEEEKKKGTDREGAAMEEDCGLSHVF